MPLSHGRYRSTGSFALEVSGFTHAETLSRLNEARVISNLLLS
jgi:hypothetical protein